jgi:hypothetical protein
VGVDEITLDDLAHRWHDVESVVDETPAIDRWCSGPDWQLPVTQGFSPRGKRLLLASDSPRGYALLGHYRLPDGRLVLGGIEPLWGFGCPILGNQQGAVAEALADRLVHNDNWSSLVLPGFSNGDSTIDVAVALGRLGAVGVAEGITRQVADLSDGYDAWFNKRSSRFRRNLRQATRKAADAGLEIVDVSGCAEVFPRLLAIEQQSWKGHDDSGITSVEMTATYRAMVDRLAQRNRLHVHIARLGDADVGYILGGIRNRRYRGLQLSYTEQAGHLSVGNLLQHHQIQLLEQHDLAHTYDLGMDIDYKRRWADRAETTVSLVVNRA